MKTPRIPMSGESKARPTEKSAREIIDYGAGGKERQDKGDKRRTGERGVEGG